MKARRLSNTQSEEQRQDRDAYREAVTVWLRPMTLRNDQVRTIQVVHGFVSFVFDQRLARPEAPTILDFTTATNRP